MNPFIYSSYVDYLKAVRESYGQRKQRIPLQAWAKRLGYKSPRSLEMIISGDRIPSAQLVDRISKDLKLTQLEKAYFTLMVQREKALRKEQPVHDLEKEMDRIRPAKYRGRYISNEIFQRVSEWYPLVIRQLTMTPDFKDDIAWITQKLRRKITNSQVAAALAEWKELAFDRRTLYTPDDVPSLAVRSFHKKMLRKAIDALDEFPVDEREYFSLTFRSSKKNMQKLKKVLRETRDYLNEELNDESGNEIFQVSLAFFPHTDLKK